ncbi:MAG: endo-1,4-beta-xylanase [Chitinophagales bacterium]
MKHIYLLTLILLLLSAVSISAQDGYHQRLLTQLEEEYGLVGGEWIVSGSEFTTMSNVFYWGLSHYTLEDAEGQTFTKSITATVSELAENPWSSGVGIINNQPIEVGDKLLIVVWMRGTTATAEGAFTSMYFEDNTNYVKEVNMEAKISKEWQQYFIPFESKRHFDSWEAQIAWHLNFHLQTVEIGGLAVLNYGKAYEFLQLPEETNLTYDGRAANAAWRTSAAERIDTHRKANLQITVVDENGRPIPNATVGVKMQQHDYAFGTSIVGCAVVENDCQEDIYQEKILNLDGKGHGFNQVTFENDMNWNVWEENELSTPEQTISAIQWLVDHHIQVRGRTLVEPSWDMMPSDMIGHSGDINYLKNRIDQHLENMLHFPAIAENVQEWDVMNELLGNRSLEFAFVGKSNYLTGRELYAEIFKKARKESPDMIAYLNDCVAICADEGNGNAADYNRFKTYLQELIDKGVQIDGVGFQAHIGKNPISPETIYNTLENFYQTFGLKIKITEFDMVQMSKSVSADYMRDFLTVVFSHPSTEGFLMDGFWDSKHGLGDAVLFDNNWHLKPSGQSFIDLVFKEWWTNKTLLTNENGRINIRAFKGSYNIPVNFNGETYSTTLQLKADETLVIELPITTSIEEIEHQNRFVLYPNPSNGTFELQYDFPQNGTLQFGVYDILGRPLQNFSKNVIPQKMFTHPFELKSGIYFVKVQDGQRIMVEKVIVQ